MQIYKYVIKISKFANMKKNTFLFLLSLILFSSCETDFNVNADWEEVMVVYGLLDQSQDKQYIRVNKAFLGDGNKKVWISKKLINCLKSFLFIKNIFYKINVVLICN